MHLGWTWYLQVLCMLMSDLNVSILDNRILAVLFTFLLAMGGTKGLAHRCKNPQPEWSVFREASFGHGELKLVNSTHAFWSWHRNNDDEPVRSDQLRITSLESSGCLAEKKHYLRKIFMAPWYWRYGILMPWPIQD